MKIWSCLGLLISLLLISGACIEAQDRYVVSARAGIVNFVSGQASVTRVGGAQASLLRQDTIEVGDIASTADGGYAEVLLNPGSYLRLGPNSRFRFGSTSLEDTSIELLAGSAIFEINADNAFTLSVTTPSATLRLDRSGIYRVDLEPPPGDLEVIKGSALVGSTEVKAGRMLRLELGAIPEKFDPKALDALALWSDSRAKELARITNAVQTQALNNALASSYYLNMWDFLPSWPGLWIWDRSFGGGFFLPFGGRHHSRWAYGYCSREPFDWNRNGWKERRDHPRQFSRDAFAGNKDQHPKPVQAQKGTVRNAGDHQREPWFDRTRRQRGNDGSSTRGGSDSTHSGGGGRGAGGGSKGTGGDNSHQGSNGGGGSTNNGGGSGSRGGGGWSNSGGGGGSHSGGGSGSSSGGGGGSHSGGGSGSSSSGGSHSSGSSSGSHPSGSSSGSSTTTSSKQVKDQ